MKNCGKVVKFNGVYGSIRDLNGIDYTLLDKNMIDKDIKEADLVEFEDEEFLTPETEVKIARFVKVLKKNK